MSTEVINSGFVKDMPAETFKAYIVRDKHNQDGWVGRRIPDGKVCFFKNLPEHVMELEPGDVWQLQTETDGERYTVASLLQKASKDSPAVIHKGAAGIED